MQNEKFMYKGKELTFNYDEISVNSKSTYLFLDLVSSSLI